MLLKDIIRAEKEIVSAGVWAVGKMSRSAFPMSKARGNAYRLGNREWRVVVFKALARECRLLITVSSSKHQYQAWLGLITSTGDTKIIAQLELHGLHGGHGGWHVHAACGPIEDVPSGIRRGPWIKRLKRGDTYLSRHPFDFGRADAFATACRFYRLDVGKTGTLL
jgi:hypothetical protein